MKTLYGAHQPDEGTILVDGQVQHFRSPAAAIRHGIGMVFQHFMLADNFTVWENIVLGREPGWPVLARNAARTKIRALGSRYGLEIDPDELVSDLGVGEKQRVEILKVLYRGAEILILDEPTAVLVPHEVDELFASLRELTGSKATVLFISHKLDEVLEYADAITVIRAGKTVGEVDDPSTVTAEQLAEMMVGSELPSPETRESTVTDRVLLEVADLAVEPGAHAGEVTLGITTSADLFTGAPGAVAKHRPLDGVSIEVHAGEIVGIAGVEGNGQAELIDAIVGLVPATGTVLLDGNDVSKLSTLARRTAGIGLIPEDRQRDGMVLAMPLWENVLLGHQASARVHRPRADRPGRLPPARRRGRQWLRRAHAEHRRAGLHVVGRQPAEADRRSGDAGQADGADRRPPDPRRRRRRPGRDLGHPARRPGRRPGHAADLRRPRGADRPLRPPARDAARPHRRRPRPGDGEPGRPRRLHDRRPDPGRRAMATTA